MLNFLENNVAAEPASSGSVNGGPLSDEIVASPLRWLMLLIFALLNATNAILWISFASVSAQSGLYYGVGVNSVNLLSLVYMMLYLPASLFAAHVFSRHGLQAGMRWGAGLNLASAALRYASAGDNNAARTGGFALVLIGQILGACAQPFFTNSPAKLAGEWFPVHQRNLATTIASMCNPIGIAIGQVRARGACVCRAAVHCRHTSVRMSSVGAHR